MKHNYYCKYDNILIRQLNKEDIENIRQWRNEPSNTKYLRKIPYITSEMQEEWYNRYLLDEDEMTFAIVENKEFNRVIGSLSLYNFKKETVEFGKILIGDSETRGRGCGANSVRAVVDLALNQLGKKTVYLHVFKDNVDALKTYLKVGFEVTEKHVLDGMIEYTMSVSRKTLKGDDINA